MKLLLMALLGGLAFGQRGAWAATNQAQIRMFNLSVRAEEGVASRFGNPYQLRFFSGPDPATPNGELWNLLQDAPPTHASGFQVIDPLWDTALYGPLPEGALELTVPEDVDADTNGVPDFYEVSQAISASSNEGGFVVLDPLGGLDPLDEGPVVVQWQRAAGSRFGQLRVRLASPPQTGLWSDLTFIHTFEIFEYAGTLAYVPTKGRVEAVASLVQVGGGGRRLTGTLPITRDTVDPANRLDLGGGLWTNADAASLQADGGSMNRDPGFALEYFGGFGFDDGDPATPEVDFELFYVGVDDPNDADGDGIPDLSDTVGGVPATLAIERTGASLLLTLSGAIGTTYSVQWSPTLPATNWATVTSVVLVAPSQTIPLTLPASGNAFWRALVP